MAVTAFEQENWQNVQGISSLILISAGGTSNYDYALAGQMAETVLLQRLPSLKKRLKTLNRPLSRCRVIRLPHGEHALREASFHRFIRQLIYIPLVHFPETQFYVENELIPLHLNESFQLSGSQVHKIVNANTADCMYLQIETLHSESISNTPFLEPHHFEILTPEQFQHLISVINTSLAESTLDLEKREQLQQANTQLINDWEVVFNRFGKNWAGELSYQDVLLDFSALMNGKQAYLNHKARYALAIIETVLSTTNRPKPKRYFSRYFFAANQPLPDATQCPHFEKPIFIISAPRAGSTLLFETLAQFPNVWSIGEEIHELLEDIPSLHPATQNFDSNCLTAAHATADVIESLKKRFVRQLRNRDGIDYLKLDAKEKPKTVRFLEKTPKNALRIPFLKAAFPDALFVYLNREPKENISSLLEGWRSLRFIAYRNLPDWVHQHWSFVLPKGWRKLHGVSLASIAAYQWQSCNDTIVNDLKNLPVSDWCYVSYTDLVTNPKETLIRIAHFAELDKDNNTDELLRQTLPISRLTLSPPATDKWRRYESELNEILKTDKQEIFNAN